MWCEPEDSWEELEPVLVINATVINLRDVSINRFRGNRRYDASEMGTDSQPGRALLRAGYPFTQEGTITVGGDPVSRSQGLAASVATIVNSTEVLRFSDQAEWSETIRRPAHPDLVLRAALQAEGLRADVDTCVLTARTDAAEVNTVLPVSRARSADSAG